MIIHTTEGRDRGKQTEGNRQKGKRHRELYRGKETERKGQRQRDRGERQRTKDRG
jgi:hypothetical protein